MNLFSSFTRRNYISLAAMVTITTLSAGAFPQLVYAYDEQSTSSLNVDSKGVALKGYDPVSYFSSGGPATGKSGYTATHDGATYWFANAENRDIFKANPSKYSPAYGGFCAMGIALEKKLDVNPQLWRIVDGKLYLNIHKEAQARWLEDTKGNISQADKIWAKIKDKAPKTL